MLSRWIRKAGGNECPHPPAKSTAVRNIRARMQRPRLPRNHLEVSDGRLAEIFISNAKAGSHSDAAAKDAAVVASIALQHGVPIDVIRHALLRDSRGRASSPLGCALDLIAEGEP